MLEWEHVPERLGSQAPGWTAQENENDTRRCPEGLGRSICYSLCSVSNSLSHTTFQIKWEVYFFKEVFARLYFCVKMYSACICIYICIFITWLYNTCSCCFVGCCFHDLFVNADKTDISTLSGKPLKLVDPFTYHGSNIWSTESDANIRIRKAWTIIDRLSIIWKPAL